MKTKMTQQPKGKSAPPKKKKESASDYSMDEREFRESVTRILRVSPERIREAVSRKKKIPIK